MSLYRGAGGASDATDDSTVNAVAGYASSAASSASAAAASATTATNNATAAATSASQAASSTSSAATSASNAATSASNAASSASSASSSASSASTSATNASNSAGNASTYASEALGYRNTASTHATNAASSASAAAGSATSAANSAASALAIYGNTAAMEAAVDDAQEAALTAQQESQAASDSAIAAAESEDLAFEYSQNAAESATTAQSAANSAIAASTSANAAWDQFDDRYLGAKAADPTVDNDGNALITGALYFNTSTSSLKVYTGSAWTDAYTTGNGFLVANNNLSDLQSAATARTNLGLGTAALENSTALVHTTGNETIAGTKTFSSTITGSITGNAGTVTNGVYTTGDQTIGGTKTFSSTISGSITGNAGTVTNGVYTTGDQTIAGTKTFSSNPVLSAGTANGVAYLNGSKVLTTGSALTFDGSSTFKVVTTGSPNLTLQSTSAGSAYLQLIPLGGGTGIIYTPAGQLDLKTSDASAMTFGISNTEQMRLTSTGLGIGTSSPGYKLDVTSSAFTIGRFVRSGAGASAAIDIVEGSGGYVRLACAGGTSNMSFRPGGTELMLLNSSGNLGIGTSSPAQKLDVNGKIRTNSWMELAGGVSSYATTGDYPIIYSWADGSINGDLILQSRSTSVTGIRFVTGATPALSMYLNASGNLGLGVTPSAHGSSTVALQFPSYGVVAGGAGYNALSAGYNFYYNAGYKYIANGYATMYQSGGSTGIHSWHIAGNNVSGAGAPLTFTQAMTLDASGNLLVGTTSLAAGTAHTFQQTTASNYTTIFKSSRSTAAQNYGLYVYYDSAAPNGTGNEFLQCQDNAAVRATIRSNGGLANYSGNNVNLSDRREKTNFAPAGEYLSKICAIPVQTFNYIDQNAEEDPGTTLGVVAQDVQAVAPELVMESNWGTEENPKMRLSIYQTDLQYALMKALQELKAEFDAYKATHP